MRESGAGKHGERIGGAQRGDDFGNQHLRSRLYPLRTEQQRRIGCGQPFERAAQMLCRGHQQQRRTGRHMRKLTGGADVRRQRQTGQIERVALSGIDRLDHFGLQRPEQDIIMVLRHDAGERGAPCACADDADGLAGHAFTPAPRTVSASGSSGQRGRAAMSSGSVNPAAKRSAPAQAIIAPLSVHSQCGGATKRMP